MATPCDAISTSLPDLSKLKQSHEQELKAQMRITRASKAELQESVERSCRATQQLNFLTDSRRLIVEKSHELLEESARLEADNKACQSTVEGIERQMLEIRELQRAAESGYSDRMNELRKKITRGKVNYGPEVVGKRAEELREEKMHLLEVCREMELRQTERNRGMEFQVDMTSGT